MGRSVKNSNWEEGAKFRSENKKWLRYSSNVARRILAVLRDSEEAGKPFNQQMLAEKIGHTPQYISKVLQGKENLSLATIAKFSEALGVELITFPQYKYNKKENPFGDYLREVYLATGCETVAASIFTSQQPVEKTEAVNLSRNLPYEVEQTFLEETGNE